MVKSLFLPLKGNTGWRASFRTFRSPILYALILYQSLIVRKVEITEGVTLSIPKRVELPLYILQIIAGNIWDFQYQKLSDFGSVIFDPRWN